MDSRSASAEPRPFRAQAPDERILVGRVLRPHGLKGEVKIDVTSDVPERFEPGRELWVAPPKAAADRRRIAAFRPVRGGGVLRLEQCDDREAAEALRGARLEVERSEVPEAPEDHYYHFELTGCRLTDARHGELGEVVAVIEDGGGALLKVRGGGRTLLVPFVDEFLAEVDTKRARIRTVLPPGLVEICASKS